MSVLSDATIKAAIERGELIRDGEPGNVKYCAYHFTPEKIFAPGDKGVSCDWCNPPVDATYIIQPGTMVWVRTRGVVKMPSNLCAFYWQTNSLSRSGLMLVNSSLVEPGYEGPLACLFVNFGKQPIPIHPDTPVAKLIFLQLDAAAGEPLDMKREPAQYDRALKDVAVLAPDSFLQVGELSHRIDDERAAAIKSVKRAARIARKNEAATLEKDFENRIKKILWVVFAGLFLLTIIINVLAFVQGKVRPNIEQAIQDRVDIEVKRRVAAETGAIAARRDSIEAASQAAIRDLRRSMDSLRTRKRP